MGLKGSSSFLFLVVFLSLGIHCNVGLGGASAASIVVKKEQVSGNGTLGDCFYSNYEFEGGDFLRHYAAGGRWLLQTGGKISFKTLQRPQVCSTPKYANCIVPGKNVRPCTDYNRCKRTSG